MEIQELPVPLTKLTKLTKKFYLAIIRQRIHNRTFDREQFKQEFNLADRRVRRYINEVANEFAIIKAPELAILKAYCIENLKEKAVNRELGEKTEAKIALSGEAQIQDINIKAKEEYTENVTHRYIYTEEEKIAILNARRIIRNKKRGADRSSSIH